MARETIHPWQSARDEFEEKALPVLKEIGKQVGADAKLGNKSAIKIIDYYEAIRRSFDPLMLVLLQNAMNSYSESKQ